MGKSEAADRRALAPSAKPKMNKTPAEGAGRKAARCHEIRKEVDCALRPTLANSASANRTNRGVAAIWAGSPKTSVHGQEREELGCRCGQGDQPSPSIVQGEGGGCCHTGQSGIPVAAGAWTLAARHRSRRF